MNITVHLVANSRAAIMESSLLCQPHTLFCFISQAQPQELISYLVSFVTDKVLVRPQFVDPFGVSSEFGTYYPCIATVVSVRSEVAGQFAKPLIGMQIEIR